jgi:FtsH-binding integral membrane protein
MATVSRARRRPTCRQRRRPAAPAAPAASPCRLRRCLGPRAGLQIIISALLTCFIFISLTVFTFVSKVDFGFLGPFLFASTLILIFWGLILGFISAFSTASIGVSMAFSLFGALLFCGFIVRRAVPPSQPAIPRGSSAPLPHCTQIYDTNQIINRMGVDDFIIAAIELYLDIINLFMYILMCSSLSSD